MFVTRHPVLCQRCQREPATIRLLLVWTERQDGFVHQSPYGDYCPECADHEQSEVVADVVHPTTEATCCQEVTTL